MRDLLVIAVTALVSASAGALIAVSMTGAHEAPAAAPSSLEVADVDELLDRIVALEEIVASSSSGLVMEPGVGQVPASLPSMTAEPPEPEEIQLTREERAAQREQQRRTRTETRLRAAGWSDAEIASLERVNDEARLRHEQRQFDAMRKLAKENEGLVTFLSDQRSSMRESMGDERFEQYLDALGRPVSVEVRDILPGSAGDTAGLRPGDEIRRYGNARVFSEQDLMRAMIEGNPGEYVTIEVERDGATMHLTVPNGPLGTSRGRGPF